MRTVRYAVVLIASSIGAACGSSATAPKVVKNKVCPPAVLSAGVVANSLDTASACVTPNVLAGVLDAQPESTLASDYTLHVQGSTGVIITMEGLPPAELASRLDLLASDSTLLATSPTGVFAPAVLAFVNGTPDSLDVRATVDDSLPADTGAYSLRVQTCAVPLAPITGAVSHTDSIQSSDCVLPSAPFVGDSSHAHLYSIHIDSGSSRAITVSSPGAVAIAGGSPHDDTFGALPSDAFLHPSEPPTGPSAYAFTLGGGPGGYFTLIISTPSDEPTSYTLTVADEQSTP